MSEARKELPEICERCNAKRIGDVNKYCPRNCDSSYMIHNRICPFCDLPMEECEGSCKLGSRL